METRKDKAWHELPQVLLSMRPRYTALELAGKKLAEVRASAPFIPDAGVTVWIYETKNDGGRGRVVARFHCPQAVFIDTHKDSEFLRTWARLSTLTVDELQERQKMHKGLYFWEVEGITEVKREIPLAEFGLTRPPQSWVPVDLPAAEYWNE